MDDGVKTNIVILLRPVLNSYF